jgi:hypothetical protein
MLGKRTHPCRPSLGFYQPESSCEIQAANAPDTVADHHELSYLQLAKDFTIIYKKREELRNEFS